MRSSVVPFQELLHGLVVHLGGRSEGLLGCFTISAIASVPAFFIKMMGLVCDCLYFRRNNLHLRGRPVGKLYLHVGAGISSFIFAAFQEPVLYVDDWELFFDSAN